MPSLRRRHSRPAKPRARRPALVAGQRRAGGRGPRRLGRRRPPARHRRRRQVALPADRLGGRELPRLADPGRDRGLEPGRPARPSSRRSSPWPAAPSPPGSSSRPLRRSRQGLDAAPARRPRRPWPASPTTRPPPVPTGPALHGTAPTFAPEAGEGVPKSAESEVLRSEAGGQGRRSPAPAPRQGSTAAGGAQANAPEVAGPAAIKVARRFADAFVLYEIGRASARRQEGDRRDREPRPDQGPAAPAPPAALEREGAEGQGVEHRGRARRTVPPTL